jgi:hypothetical protein
MPLSLILDENQRSAALWREIQTHNHRESEQALEVIRVGDLLGPELGILDPDLLRWSIENGRTVVTQDVNTLIGEHSRFVSDRIETPGLFVVRRGFSVVEIVRALVLCSYCLSPAEVASQTLYIPLD